MQFQVGKFALSSAGNLPCASCTRFSPNRRWPAAKRLADARLGHRLADTATSLVCGGGLRSRPSAPPRCAPEWRRDFRECSCDRSRETSKSRRAASMRACCVLMTDDERLPIPSPRRARLPHGSLVIVRARDARTPPRSWREALRARTQRTDPADRRTIRRWRGSSSHGLHLPEARAREAAHWRARTPTGSSPWRRIRCAALHAPHADAVLLSPVFATKSHPQARNR